MNLWKFPFDKQTCSLVFENFWYPINQATLTFKKPRIRNFENDMWSIGYGDTFEDVLKFCDNCTSGVFGRVEFQFVFTRKALYHCMSVVLPCLVVAGVELTTFAIPLSKYVRLQLSFGSLLSFSVFLTVFREQLPNSSNQPPLLFIFISIMTATIGIVTVFQALAIVCNEKAEIYKKCSKKRVGVCIRHRLPLFGSLSISRADFYCENRYRTMRFLSHFTDNLGFAFFLLFNIASPILLFTILPAGDE